jgi:hypothetical protein
MLLRTEGTYYARTEHGGHQVVADDQGFLVTWPSGAVRYPSARQTIIALTNREPQPSPRLRDPKVSFNRYFRRGRFGDPGPQIDTFALFSPNLTVVAPVIVLKSSPDLSIAIPVGIDLAKRGHEVRKLFYAGYGRRVTRHGYDPEDVLQEVYQGLLVRNRGKCPFDPSKSSFGHYVHMVCGCIVSNYRRRYSRLERNEQFGVLTMNDGAYEMQDVRDSNLAVVGPLQGEAVETESTQRVLETLVSARASTVGVSPVLARQCFGLMVKGYRKGEIVTLTGEPPNKIAKMLRLIRQTAAEWRTYVGL